LLDQALEVVWIKQGIGVGEGALADGVDVEEAVDAGQLTGMFDATQGSQYGVKKSQEVGDQHVVVKQHAIGVGIERPKPGQIVLNQLNMASAGDLLGQDLGPRFAAAFKWRG